MLSPGRNRVGTYCHRATSNCSFIVEPFTINAMSIFWATQPPGNIIRYGLI